MEKAHRDITKKIQRLLKTGSFMGAVVLLKSLSSESASRILETLPLGDQKKLYDIWLGSGETLLTELPVQEIVEKKPTKKNLFDSVLFFPDHFISEVTAMLWIICLISILTIFTPASLEVKANPVSTPPDVKPEWYLLFLYAVLHFVPPIVGILLPLIGAFFLTILPFLDKNPEVSLSKRKFALIVCVILLTIIIILSLIGATIK